MTKSILVAALLATSVAHAQPEPVTDAPESSYRAELVESELPWIGLTIGALTLGKADAGGRPVFISLATLAATTYALSGSFVHVMHGHTNRAIESVALRVATPAAFGALGWLACGCSNSHEDFGYGKAIGLIGGGVVLGAVVGHVFEIAVLGKGAERASRVVTPYAAPTQNGMAFGFAGSF
jgi:hypothetical protein